MCLSDKIHIIAEAGVNHNGSFDMAIELINIASEAAADTVKFQTFKAEKVMTRMAPKAEYQTRMTDPAESQLDMARKLELGEEAQQSLLEHCNNLGIQFLSTPFDLESIDFLALRLHIPRLKISSGDITNAPLLLQAARTGKPIILSTGMCTLGEVETALGVLAFGYIHPDEVPSIEAFNKAYSSATSQRVLREKITLLHCTTEYPARFADVNLRALETLGIK